MTHYNPPKLLKNSHVNTVYSSLLRRISSIDYQREVISTPDGETLDLDWKTFNQKKLIIYSHGLEGSSQGVYIRGMIRHFQYDYDALAWNCRGCGDHSSNPHGFYNSGFSHDLKTVITFVLENKDYQEINLVGFSMGGNITLKYLGENPSSPINKAVAISAPCDLHSSSIELRKKRNLIYNLNFLQSLKPKVYQNPKTKFDQRLKKTMTLYGFDEYFTAPHFGYQNAADYYQQASSVSLLKNITIPTLILNAKDDMFLGPKCYPSASGKLHTLYPDHGGHLGFVSSNQSYWSEVQVGQFFLS